MTPLSPRDDSRYWWMALASVPGIGAVRFGALVRKFGTPLAALEASDTELRKLPDFGDKVISSLRSEVDHDFAAAQLEHLEKANAKLITLIDSEYPENLKRIFDPPPFLIVRGTLAPQDQHAVALVGSRICTTYGTQTTETLARGLCAHGITVVSGLARGIDSAAHRGALAAGGRTIGVLGCGLDIVYPPEHKGLYEEVAAAGAIITEFPFGFPPDKYNFPSRNRIISGISRGVVVVEARKGSGALLTAKHALDQNREVFAVPGNISSAASFGSNDLLKQGAIPVTSVEDILLAIGVHPHEAPPVRVVDVNLDGEEKRLFESLSDQPQLVDNLSAQLQRPVSEILSLLLSLEMAGLVKQLPGKLFLRAV